MNVNMEGVMLVAVRKAVWASALVCGAIAVTAPALRAHSPAPEEARKIIRKVVPAYPAVARQWHLTATVKLIATVSPEGVVRRVKTLGGSPVFMPAAEAAVRQWKYEPSKNETTEAVVLVFAETP